MTKVLISILNWNNAPATIQCIESVKKSTFTEFEILVIDNNSSDDSINLLHNYNVELQIVKNTTNLGYAAGHQVAVDKAIQNKLDAIWILNNDTLVDSNALQELVLSWIKNPNALYGSLILESDQQTIRFGGSYPITNKNIDYSVKWNPLKGKNLSELTSLTFLNKVADINGSSLLIGLNIIDKYGFMPLDYFLYAEETHYCYSLREKGIPSFMVNTSLVTHFGSLSFDNKQLKSVAEYYRIRNGLFFSKRFIGLDSKQIVNQFRKPRFFISFFVKHFLYNIGISKTFKWKHYLKQLALWHFLINKKGKTISPENFL